MGVRSILDLIVGEDYIGRVKVLKNLSVNFTHSVACRTGCLVVMKHERNAKVRICSCVVILGTKMPCELQICISTGSTSLTLDKSCILIQLSWSRLGCINCDIVVLNSNIVITPERLDILIARVERSISTVYGTHIVSKRSRSIETVEHQLLQICMRTSGSCTEIGIQHIPCTVNISFLSEESLIRIIDNTCLREKVKIAGCEHQCRKSNC